ncbi:response regulator transcription factor [Campylobacter canadensis]|uniref:Response regulator transcription factor n=1 Tax=Campylobacter canadensis TaxID=449520 RepID=A0ABS7WVD0_9BACT|nr:response regulator transcription factor [Campylobacter canadensis]MBZ7987920.1 response regulator transcription factor [Campylobacter canadensis]MBZ7995396.1 response regulator transcription factor [Campylobacter canadensis]MBZ7997059.1 response regulator transcription factor [Campylobacter canadensis]MBZ7998893.1 response regulator transcription factor [Campylobacter canadensis]MBZ8000572.1 response regulator transcription factor [Campylobacter canadensis]
MKILIVENEVYLAQSIAIKLNEAGYESDIATSFNDIKNIFYDVILLSTNVDSFMKIIQNHKQSMILLLVSYVSSDTVSTPIAAGAYDYIQKPFMIEEVLRKIKYFYNYNRLKLQNQALNSYVKSVIDLKIHPVKKITFPLLIKTNNQILADSYVFNYAFSNNILLHFTDLSSSFNLNELLVGASEIRYFTNFQVLKGSKLEQILKLSKGQNFIFHTNSKNHFEGLNELCLEDKENNDYKGILTVDDYLKNMILKWQDSYTDTDLSKKLGISRKTLWEKRRKYDIDK